MTREVFLLRGINVGGRNRLPMAGLRAAALRHGATAAETYLASGNLIVTLAPAITPAAFQAQLRGAIAEEHGWEPPMVHASAEIVATAVRSVPYPVAPGDEKLCHVAFLSTAPDAAAISTLTARDFGADRVVVEGSCAYLWFPNGSQRSRLTLDRIEKDLSVTGTARNLATVRALAEILSPS